MLDDCDNPRKILNRIQIIIYYSFMSFAPKDLVQVLGRRGGVSGPLLMINALDI